ncbi:ImmA/IrrE family metallo-endopeptidase [Gluconobacter wancherniae]|uniref:ImmA/IrrE family metallo-endopeptidase n=1 Tax=Gluconobacter wancherniae TaxID=1307955 RepID=UPI001B8C2942|nr:ImmA/IrrE family metallo-endopeptidase [Gluconobacter wancherniae]MBS1063428.1 ImmA/IrrE family metallo-endopeptidase [Gluconobacter wancherniae]
MANFNQELQPPIYDRSRSANFERAKKAAASIFSQYCDNCVPVDPLKVARLLGLGVQFTQFRSEISQNILGLLEIGQNTIYVNSELPTNRATFTIAHEIGHFVLHRPWAESQQYDAFWRSPNWARGNKPPEEQEADCFASNLLVPRHILKNFMQMEDDDRALAQAFCVSEDVIFYAKQDVIWWR